MASLNKVMIIGNCGKDPEMRFTPSGKAVASFSVATSNRYQKDGAWQEETQWFKVITWNKLAERCNQTLSKGSQVYAEGRLQLSEWEGKDGQKHHSLDIVANSVLLLGKREKAESKEADNKVEPEDLPF